MSQQRKKKTKSLLDFYA